jgi:hypothetical protein
MAKDINVDLNINSNVNASISELKRLKRQLKDTEVGTDAFKNLFNQIDDLEDKIKSAKNTSSDFIDSLEMAGGPLGMLGSSINKVKVATQSFGGALKATGIGLIVALIGGLVAAFNDSEKATKKLQPLLMGLERIFNGVYGAVEPLFNILVDLAISALPFVSQAMQTVYGSVTAVIQSLGSLGSAVGKFITGDFAGAWQSAKESVTDFSKNYDDSIKRFTAGTKDLTKIEKEEAEKRRLAKIEEQKKEYAEIDELIKKNDELLKKYEEQKLKEYEDRIQKIKIIRTDVDVATKEEQDKFNKNQFDYLNRRLNEEIELEKQKSQEKVNIQQAEQDAKIAIQEAYVGNMMRLGQGLRQLAGENKELAIAGIILEQGAALANIAINTPKNFVKNGGVTSPLAWIGLAADVASAISVVKAGAKGIQDINSGTATAQQMSFGNQQMVGAYSTSPQFNVVGTSPINQAAQLMQNQQPVKAYVVSGEVSSAQSLDRNRISSATLG